MKKILILGGGQAQIELIKTAKEMNLYVVIVGIRGDYPGYQYADKIYYEDIFDKESVLRVAKTEGIDGITMVCSDFGLETVGYVNDHLHLHGITEKSAIDSSNKLKMKELLQKADVNTARFLKISNEKEVEIASSTLSYPLIVKAVDLQGSRGIYLCRTKDELLKNFKLSICESRKDYCIVEEYIEGKEFGAQAFIYDDDILFVQPHGDSVYHSGERNIPIGHYMPMFESGDEQNDYIVKLVKNAIKALHFNNCAVNVDLIIKDNIPYVIELTGRAGANYLPELTSSFLGINYYKLILLSAIGESPLEYFSQRKVGAKAVATMMIYSKTSGIISDIVIPEDPQIKNCSMFVKNGDHVCSFKSSSDCIGKVLCVGDNISDCSKTLNNFIKKGIRYQVN